MLSATDGYKLRITDGIPGELGGFWLAPVPPPPPDSGVALGQSVTAVANSGRWVVSCPFCGSAQLAHREDRTFVCVEDANLWADYLPVVVVWPEPEVVEVVEAILDARPGMFQQNWTPAETIVDLAAENTAAGLPVPDSPLIPEVEPAPPPEPVPDPVLDPLPDPPEPEVSEWDSPRRTRSSSEKSSPREK